MTWRAALLVLAALCSPAADEAHAQANHNEQSGPSARGASGQPDRWVKRLEIPTLRNLAMERLLAIGPTAVPSLIERVDDPRAEVRIATLQTLGLFGTAAAAARDRVARLTQSDDSRIRVAATSTADAIQGGRGHLLVADFSQGELLELNGRGEIAHRFTGLPEVRSLQPLTNGNYLVSAKNWVVELNRAGAHVWKHDCKAPNAATRLDNGNTLIASANEHRVFEVDATGQVVWDYSDGSVEFRPVSCQRLPDGRTLVADYPAEDPAAGRVFEVDRDKRIVWSLNWKMPAFARRLTRNRTLIVSHRPGRVQIVDRAGKVLQAFKDVRIPSTAKLLANGHLLVGGEGFLREFDAAGKQLWDRSLPWVTAVHRH